MHPLSEQVEDVILQFGTRGMDRLRPGLTPGYCRRAAELILANRGVVLAGTGFPVSGTFESDGPIGAIALYRVLMHLGHQPILVCAPPISDVLARGFFTYALPLDGWEKSHETAIRILAELNPSLVVSVERPGRAADGRYYNMHRRDITAATAKFDLFFQECNCPSIAFGDGGNEIGMGNLRRAMDGMDIIPAETACTELVIATVSNWGVYGVIAMLSHLLKEDLFQLFDPHAIAEYLFANGCIDGVTNSPEPGEDGFGLGTGLAIIRQLQQLVGIPFQSGPGRK